MKLTSDPADRFTMVNQHESKKLNLQLKEGKLKPIDVLVTMYLSSYIDIQSGLINRRSKDIADDLGMQTGRVYQSLKRLRDECYLAKGLRGTGYFWMLNPYIWTVGKKQLQQKRIGLFMSLINE